MTDLAVSSASPATIPPPRTFTRAEFDRAYNESVAKGEYFEIPAYYQIERERYYKTLLHYANLPLPRPARVLEIGGGQIAILSHKLFGDKAKVGDITEEYADSVRRQGVEFCICNLLHDDLPERDEYDAVVLCEVIEHLPVPAYIALGKVAKWLKPGGKLLLTTPNLYRIRNVVRLALGMPVFANFRYPRPGTGLGHQLEYSSDHLAWQLREAGFEVDYIQHVQFTNRGHSLAARIGRLLIAPFHLLPRWRDNLMACATRPASSVSS